MGGRGRGWRHSQHAPAFTNPLLLFHNSPSYGVEGGHVTITEMVCPKKIPATALTYYVTHFQFIFLINFARVIKKENLYLAIHSKLFPKIMAHVSRKVTGLDLLSRT